jgi:hypothetical protein
MNKNGLFLTRLLMLALAFNLVAVGMASAAALPAPASGAFGTADYISWQHRDQRIERVQAFLAEERVQAHLVSLGVDPSAAQERVAALTAEELAMLEHHIDGLPAGGNVLTVLGVVFVVLLVLELVGAINIFAGI